MANDFMEFLKENFESPDALNLDQIRKMISEANKYFASLEVSLRSDNEKMKEEALAQAFEIRQFLEAKANLFAPFIGTEPTEEERAMVVEISEGLNISSREKGKHLLKPKIKVS